MAGLNACATGAVREGSIEGSRVRGCVVHTYVNKYK